MSQPRSVIPGASYLITRRTLRRHLLLRPDEALTQLVLYALAVSAHRHGIQVHAVCVMSTHHHLVITDVRGTLPRFLQLFHRLVALATKVLRSWEGPVWGHEPTSVVRLMTQQAVVEKIAYTLANPVAAGLVRRGRDWPGAKVLVEDLGRGVLNAKRPDVYFNPNNPQWPAEATVALALPPDVEQGGADGFRQRVGVELDRQEEQARVELNRRGTGFLGAERASKVAPWARATSFELLRDCNPTFAVGRGQPAAWQRAAAAVRAFRAAYRRALATWRTGVRSVTFPAGTWCMRVLHAAYVDEADDPLMAW